MRTEIEISRPDQLAPFAHPWAIHDTELDTAVERVLTVLDRMSSTESQAIEGRVGNEERERRSLLTDVGSTRVVRLHGVMLSFSVPQFWCDWLGLAVTARVQKYFMEAVEDPRVERIVLDVDSPGGMIGGVAEFAQCVVDCGKTVHAHVRDIGASAAYWVASGADTVSVVTTGMVGSVGVRMVAARWKPDKVSWEELEFTSTQTPRKAMDLWHPDEEKRRQARADVQKILDDSATVFIDHVRSQRGDHDGKLDGRVFVGAEAVAAGYADVLSTLGAVLAPPREENRMSRNGTEGAATAENPDQERIDAIAALDIPDTVKWQAVREGKTPLEAMQLAYEQKGAAPAGGELDDRKAHEQAGEAPAAATLPAGGATAETTEFMSQFRQARERMGRRGRRQSTLVAPTAGTAAAGG